MINSQIVICFMVSSVIDQRWHRARVLEADNENRMASVFLVDYGKEEVRWFFKTHLSI